MTIARLPWDRFWDVVSTREATMSLYYLLLRGWTSISDSELFVRSLSASFSVATVPFLYLLARKVLDPSRAAAAALLLSINALFIHHAQEARGYSLLVLLVTVSTYLYVLALEGAWTKGWLIYVAVSALAVYASFFAGFVLIAHQAALPLVDARSTRRDSLLSFGAVLLLTTPLIVFSATGDSDRWIGYRNRRGRACGPP